MTKRAETVLKRALDLPPGERAELIEGLFRCFDTQASSREALWVKEAESRIDAYEAGKISAVSAEEISYTEMPGRPFSIRSFIPNKTRSATGSGHHALTAESKRLAGEGENQLT